MTNKKIERVEVTWVDSHRFPGLGNIGEKTDYAENAYITCKSTGYLLKKTKKRVILCQSMSFWNKELIDNVDSILLIPMCTVKKIDYLERIT